MQKILRLCCFIEANLDREHSQISATIRQKRFLEKSPAMPHVLKISSTTNPFVVPAKITIVPVFTALEIAACAAIALAIRRLPAAGVMISCFISLRMLLDQLSTLLCTCIDRLAIECNESIAVRAAGGNRSSFLRLQADPCQLKLAIFGLEFFVSYKNIEHGSYSKRY